MTTNGTWLPILEYARFKKISISTIRRYIKAERVKYKLENGRYYIFALNYVAPTIENNNVQDRTTQQLLLENEALRREYQRAQEEISELKMLISVYEKNNGERARLNEGASVTRLI